MRLCPLIYIRIGRGSVDGRLVGGAERRVAPPVAHTLLEDEEATDLLLRQIMRRLLTPRGLWSRLVRLKPDVVLHLSGEHPTIDGVDPDRFESLRQMAIRGGAREAYIWIGSEPSDADMLRGSFLNGSWLGDAPRWAAP